MMQRLELRLKPGEAAYFASDFHLGAPDGPASMAREKKIVRWLDAIASDCRYLFLVGDVFDFWFEYKHVVPKGYVRFLGKLAELADRGVEIYLFTGNHDMWMFGYLEKQLSSRIFRQPVEVHSGQMKMLVGHGDGLGPGDFSYKILKRVFENRLCQWLFAALHPGIGFGIAKAWSSHSRIANHRDEQFLGEEEFLWQYCRKMHAMQPFNYYIFGHRHLPLDLPVGENSRYLNPGEWMNHCRYLRFDGKKMEMIEWEPAFTP
jgi:UDP-2,3-diacylglucosamine hydrolase